MKTNRSRRQPHIFGQEEDEDGRGSSEPVGEAYDQGPFYPEFLAAQISDMSSPLSRLTAYSENTPVVIRPSIVARGSGKSKKRSSLRMSFGPEGTSMTEDNDEEGGSVVITPKKTSLGRQAVEKNALRKSLAASISSDFLQSRQTADRPSYSADHLYELKTSTPSTPKVLRSQSDVENQESKTLDLATKFGSDLIVQDSTSAIPTDAEIREKKQRRARLAKEQDFISLDDDDNAGAGEDDQSSNDERSILPYAQHNPSKKEETRLVRDDEDIAEGFDDFVSDGRIALGKKAEREQKRRHEVEIRNMIEQAEGGGSDDSSEDDSEVERTAAYEAAQTRKGMDGLHRNDEGVRPRRPRTPPKITPLPTLNGCLERLKSQLAAKQYSLRNKEKRLEEIEKEKGDIKTRQEEVQQLLEETGDRYEKLRVESASEGSSTNGMGTVGAMVAVEGMVNRRLEGFGNG